MHCVPDQALKLSLTIRQVAQATGQSYTQIRQWIEQGRLPAQSRPGNGHRRRYVMTLGELLSVEASAAGKIHNLLLTTSQAARLGGISVDSVRAMAHAGTLRCIQPNGTHMRYRLSDVLKAVENE